MVRRSANLAKVAMTNGSKMSKRVCEIGVGVVLLCGAGCGSSTPVGGAPASSEATSPTGTAPVAPASPSNSASSTGASTASPSTASGAAGAASAPAASTPAVPAPINGAPVQPAVPATTSPGGTAATPVATTPGSAPTKPMTSSECGLKTSYPGDEYCINAPAPDKGWQMHIGPTDYDNVDPQYILMPGEEITNSFSTVSTNTEKKFFYYRQFRQRPGAHHNIISASSPTGGGPSTDVFGDVGGRRIGTTNHLIEDSPAGGVSAPENEGVGIPLEPNSRVSVSLHSINTTDKPLLREIWVNFMYRPAEEVTEPVEQMFQTGDVTFQIQPREDKVLGPYSCNIQGDGRMLWFYGHRHANNVRFSATRIRDGKRELFYEGLNWEDPLVLEYSSTVKNVAPDAAKMIEGGWSGILDFKTGDTIEWECHIVNKTDQVLRFSNNTYTGEMCIMDAELVGANCPSAGGFGAGL